MVRIAAVSILMIFSVGCKSGQKVAERNPTGFSHNVTVASDKVKNNPREEMIVKEAMSWIGVGYAYGKSDKKEGTDCSGMVLKVYEAALGIKLPRNSAQQAEFCKEIGRNEIRPGDLCFFATGSDPDRISHVGIMVDDVNFIHSSTKKGVVMSQIDTPYYVRVFKRFGRVR